MIQTVHEVVINFRVHAPNATPRDRVWLLGSLPELGEWNPTRAIETGQVAGEWKVWQATVRMPVEASFQWGWCTLTVEGHLKRWESLDKRERQIHFYSGTLHTEWGDTCLEIFQQNTASAELKTEKKTKRGHVVAVLGSSHPLGAWDPKRAVIAQEYPKRSGNWTATIFFDAGTLQEWNWVIIDEASKEVKLMEKCATRFLNDTHGWIKMHVPWNKKEATVDWATNEYVGGGDTYIGTVDQFKERRARLMEIRRWEEAAEARRLGRPLGYFIPSPTMLQRPMSPSSIRSQSPASLPKMATSPTTPPLATTPPTATEGRAGSVAPIKPSTPSSYDVTSSQSSGEDFFRSPDRKISPTSAKTAAQYFAEFKPVLKIKPYSDGQQDSKAASGTRSPPKNPSSGAATPVGALPKPSSAAKPEPSPSKQASSGTQTVMSRPPAAGARQVPRQPGKPPESTQDPPEGSRTSGIIKTGKCLPSLGDIFSPRSSREKLNVNKSNDNTSGKRSGRGSSQDSSQASVVTEESEAAAPDGSKRRSRQMDPVDMSTLGFKGNKPPADEGQGKKSLVSEPGKPGYPRQPKTVDGDTIPVRSSRDSIGCLSRARSHSPPYQSAHRSPSPGVENYMCHTVQGRESWARTASQELIPVAASASWGSSVGILYDPEKPRVGGSRRLQKLQQMTEQREQARASDRLESIRQREERNKSKFQEDKKFVLVTAGVYPRSPPGGSPTRLTAKRPEEEPFIVLSIKP